MKTAVADIGWEGMDLRALKGTRLVRNMQFDRWGGLVSRPPFLGVGLAGGPAITDGEDAVLLPAINSGAFDGFILADGTSDWEYHALSGVDPDAPVAVSTSVGSSGSPGTFQHCHAFFAGGTFCARGTTLFKTGAAYSTSTSTIPIAAEFMAAVPWEPRLAIALNDRIHFSDLDAPTTWGTDNWVDVYPGDGEKIAGMASWGNYLFVFKQSRFFVFYGTSTDADGEPEFNYRTVHSPGAVADVLGSNGAVASGERGVYHFSPRGGIRLTTGGPSRPMEPACPSMHHRHLVADGGSVYALNTAVDGEVWSEGSVYDRPEAAYVFDETAGRWAQWWVDAGAPLHRLVPVGEGALAGVVGDAVYWIAPDYHLDRLDVIDKELLPLEGEAKGTYITGGLDFGTPGVERTIEEVALSAELTYYDAGAGTTTAQATVQSIGLSQHDDEFVEFQSPSHPSESGEPPYIRTRGGRGTRHFFRVDTEEGGAGRWLRLQAVVSEPEVGPNQRLYDGQA